MANECDQCVCLVDSLWLMSVISVCVCLVDTPVANECDQCVCVSGG